jgi:hypothetical protein
VSVGSPVTETNGTVVPTPSETPPAPTAVVKSFAAFINLSVFAAAIILLFSLIN